MSTRSFQSSARSAVTTAAASSINGGRPFAFAGQPWHQKRNKIYVPRSNGSKPLPSLSSGGSSTKIPAYRPSAGGNRRLSRQSSTASSGSSTLTSYPVNTNVFYDAHETPNAARRAAAARIALAWRNKAKAKRQRRVQQNVVSKLQAKEQRYRKQRQGTLVANTLTSRFTGQPVANLQRERRDRARKRWRVAINAARPSKAKLLEAVRFAYLAMDATARAQGYANLTRLLQANVGALMLSIYESQRKSLLEQRGKFYATVQAVKHCARGVSGSVMSSPPAYIATYIVLRGWDAACNKYEAVNKVATVVNDRFVAGVDGAMKKVWAGLGRSAAWALPMVFDRLVKNRLTAWVSKTSPALVNLIDFDRVTAALKRHKQEVGDALVGKDVDLLPVVMAVAASLDACVVQAIIANFMPHQQLSSDCKR